MKLFYRKIEGTGTPIIVLHGLFGSSKNWITNAKLLSQYGPVYLPDARNHGDSPHANDHRLDDMIEDLKEFIESENLLKPILIGHSMGGLVAGIFAIRYPNLLSKLLVIDISPRSYEVRYENEFAALNMDVSNYPSRQEIDSDMAKILPDPFIRQFLQMNLERTELGYRWKLNISGIQKSRQALTVELQEEEKYTGESIFIIGEISEYITEADYTKIRKHFPNAKLEIVKDGDHYLHYKKNQEFISILNSHLPKYT